MRVLFKAGANFALIVTANWTQIIDWKDMVCDRFWQHVFPWSNHGKNIWNFELI